MAKIQKNAAIQARRVMAMDRNGERRRTDPSGSYIGWVDEDLEEDCRKQTSRSWICNWGISRPHSCARKDVARKYGMQEQMRSGETSRTKSTPKMVYNDAQKENTGTGRETHPALPPALCRRHESLVYVREMRHWGDYRPTYMTNDRSNSHERALLYARLRLHLKPSIIRSRSRDKARQPTPLEAPKPAPIPDIDVPQSAGFDVIGYAVVENAAEAADIQDVRCAGSRRDSEVPMERSQSPNESGEVMATRRTPAESVGEDVRQQQAQWVLGSENKLSRGDYHLDGG
ncbi:hypothetical protein AnigIFM59636_006580 [Aspergillus niger]|nr:hypothetical protein AnigIFM59636_006580 [Aspergillus niger]